MARFKGTIAERRFFLIFGIFLTGLLVVGAEGVLRFKGYKPWAAPDLQVLVEPGGTFFTTHPSLGYTHIPGEFTVRLRNAYTFQVRHGADTLRVTHPMKSRSEQASKQEVWLFGCSFTHGWSLNDRETYPWLLQEELPHYVVRNFGVSGYGTVQSLIQFREAIEERKKPKIAILAYASFHDVRNTLARSRKKTLAPYNTLDPLLHPYVRINKRDELTHYMAEVQYREFPLMRHSALMHFIEQQYNKLEERLLKSHAVTEQLVGEFAELAQKNDIMFIIAVIRAGANADALMRWAQAKGILVVDISVDLRKEEHRNLPYDRHPSPLANRKFADKLEQFLTTTVLDKRSTS